MSSDDFRSEQANGSCTAPRAPTHSTCETDQMIGGLNGCAGPAPGNDAVLGPRITVFWTGAMASAIGVVTTATLGCAHKAAHPPWEQQRSQFGPCGMLLHGTSTGA